MQKSENDYGSIQKFLDKHQEAQLFAGHMVFKFAFVTMYSVLVIKKKNCRRQIGLREEKNKL